MTRIATVVEPGEVVHVIAADPTDDRVLEAGRAYDADVIVSGDRHRLDLRAWAEIEIVSPAAFIAGCSG
jgi:predicted nucleic acid-binding protein